MCRLSGCHWEAGVTKITLASLSYCALAAVSHRPKQDGRVQELVSLFNRQVFSFLEHVQPIALLPCLFHSRHVFLFYLNMHQLWVWLTRRSNSTSRLGSFSPTSWWGRRSRVTLSHCPSSIVRTRDLCFGVPNVVCEWARFCTVMFLFYCAQWGICMTTRWSSSATSSISQIFQSGCASPRGTPTTTAFSTGPQHLPGRVSSRYLHLCHELRGRKLQNRSFRELFLRSVKLHYLGSTLMCLLVWGKYIVFGKAHWVCNVNALLRLFPFWNDKKHLPRKYKMVEIMLAFYLKYDFIKAANC